MKKYYDIKLTLVEIQHILTLIEDNEREGWYFGNKEHYWIRSGNLKSKLEDSTNDEP